MSEISAKNFRVIIAAEGTYKTDAVEPLLTTATADIVYIDARTATLMNNREIFNPSRVRASNSGVRHISFSNDATVEMEVPLTGKAASGAGNEAPYYDVLWGALGFKKVVVSATSATYTPATVNQSAMTMYKYSRNMEDANYRLQYATGIRGTATLSLAMNEEASLSFSGSGIYQQLMTDAAAFFNATTNAIALLKDGTTPSTARTTGTEVQDDKTALGCSQMTVTLGATTLPISTAEINFNRSVDKVATVNGSETVSKVLLSVADATRIEGSFDLQDGDAAFDALRDALAADSEGVLTFVLQDGTDTITITMGKAQIGVYTEGANGGVRTFSVPFFLNGDWSSLAADNDMSIAYT